MKRLRISGLLIAVLLMATMLIPGATPALAVDTYTLTVKYFAGMDGVTGPVTPGDVALYRVTPTASGAINIPRLPTNGVLVYTGLINGTYRLHSSMGNGRDDSVTVNGNSAYDVPCGTLTVRYFANDNPGLPMNGVSTYVKKFGQGNGGGGVAAGPMTSAAGVSGPFKVLAGSYDVASTPSRIDQVTVVAGINTDLNVPVGRFRVQVVKADFITPKAGVTVYVKTPLATGGYATNGGVCAQGNTNSSGYIDFTLLQSAAAPGTVGVGTYGFCVNGLVQSNWPAANVNKIPPAGQTGVIIIIP